MKIYTLNEIIGVPVNGGCAEYVPADVARGLYDALRGCMGVMESAHLPGGKEFQEYRNAAGAIAAADGE